MTQLVGVTGIRVRSGIRPDAAGRGVTFGLRPALAAVMAVAVIGIPAAVANVIIRDESANQRALAAQVRDNQELRQRITSLEARLNAQPDWTAIVRRVEPSVLTIETSGGLGSAWVVHADSRGSDLVTNFHVVADAWNAGDSEVDVKQGDRTIKGVISRVDRDNDLAIVHVTEQFNALPAAESRPDLGTTVMAVGSPLGLAGSLSIGVVSGYRSIDGSDYVQFSAPISPGNSGGPVVDGQGRVVAVAAAKFEGTGVEALSLAIPVQTVCTMLVTCDRSPGG
jgi:S1-C subfamily serine protease